MTPLMEQAAFEMTADAGKEQELKEKYKRIKEEVKRLLSKIMIRYNVDEEYIRSLLQEEI